MNINVYPNGCFIFDGETVSCALGRSGVSASKHEGDGATPIGVFPLLRLFWRRDKVSSIDTKLPHQDINVDDGWCDDPAHPNYNQLIKLPFDASHERMWRDDDLYDLVIEVGHNNDPVVPGHGSAVFIHIAKPDYSPTEGCIAIAKKDFLRLLPKWSAATNIEIFDAIND